MKLQLSAILVPLTLLSSLVSHGQNSAPPRPNIIFILTDDLGPGDIGVLWQNGRTGTQKYQTPHLDQFAAEGKILSRHYSPISVCAPSRASLLLGVHQGHANVRDNQFDKELENNHTIATVLKQAGYATANIGKWGLAGANGTFPGHPQKRGFDYFLGYINHGDAHFHYPKETAAAEGVNARIYDGYTNITDQLDKAYSTDFITARSKKWIIDQKTQDPAKPFFLYLAYTAPHARLDVPTQAYPAGGGLTGGLQWTGVPGALVNTASGTVNSYIHPDYASTTWPEHAKRHATMVRRLDDSVHDLIQTLKDLQIDDNTLIVFTSDNGTHNEAGSGGSIAYNPTFFGTYGPYDGIKRDLWEGGIRMPAIVRWPAGIPANTTSANPSQFHDWLATFAELAGVGKPERSDGVSIVPTLTGQGEQKSGVVYSEYYYDGSTPNYADFEASHRGVGRQQQQVIQIGDFKGIRTNISTHEGSDFRIYNVATDLKETTDLSGQPGVPTQREFKDRVLRNRIASANATRPYDSALVPAVQLPGFTHGLEWRSHEVETPWVTDLENAAPSATGTTATPDTSVRTRDEDVSLVFNGYLRVPQDGNYTFHLSGDTGAFVRLHEIQILDADRGYVPGTEISSPQLPLKAGFHPIHIHYRHGDAPSHELSLKWSGTGLAKQEIPADAYFIEGPPVPTQPVAGDDSARTTTGASVDIAVLGNDFDNDGLPLPLSISSLTQPGHGTATIEGTVIRYMPRAGFHGEDSFTYTTTDGESEATATVRVTVHAANGELWFPLDENSGTTVHEAGGRPLGHLTGFASSAWTSGKLHGGLRFNSGTTAHKVIVAGEKGVTGKNARTIAFWANVDADQGAGNRATLISWGASNGSGAAANGRRFDINLNHSTGYRFRVELNGGGVNFHTASVSDPRGAGWVHVVIVIPENSTFAGPRGYINGQLATAVYEGGSASTTAIDTTAANDITFGNWATDGARPFRGVLDDIRIYPRALGAGEVAALAGISADDNAAAAWFFRNTGRTSPTSEDWNADPDGDGLSNILEYALGGNPNITAEGIAPSIHAETGAFTFQRRRSGIAHGRYIPEYSADLVSWLPLPGVPTVTPHESDAEIENVTVSLPAEIEESGVFVRLRFQSVPE